MSAVKNVIKDNYNMMLLKDYLREAIKDAGFSHAEISKTPTGTRVALHVTRPGIVIGRKGSGIRWTQCALPRHEIQYEGYQQDEPGSGAR